MLAALLAAIRPLWRDGLIVVQRAREIGVRIALGASSRDVVRLVMCVRSHWSGNAIGLTGAWGLTRMGRSRLYGIRPTGTLTLAAATAWMILVALVAGYVPALRASRVDPMRAMRWE